MAPTGYAPAPTWQPSPYPQQAPADLYYQQQPSLGEFRQLLTRLTEKVDSLNEKVTAKGRNDAIQGASLFRSMRKVTKIIRTWKRVFCWPTFNASSKYLPETYRCSGSIFAGLCLGKRNDEKGFVRSQCQSRRTEFEDFRITRSKSKVRRNSFFRPSRKNRNVSLISIRLIEQSHQTAEQRNVVVNNVSEQTAQKILELEKQKVELTNSLSVSMSKIGELQLQVNQLTEEANESQSRLTKLTGKCEQSREERDKAESQRAELQAKVEAIEEQLKTEKLSKKQLQSNCTALAEELNEVKVTLSTIEKVRRATFPCAPNDLRRDFRRTTSES